MSDIASAIESEYGADALHTIVSDDNADELVVRIRCIKDDDEMDKAIPEDGDEDEGDEEGDDDVWLKLLEQSLFRLPLRGVADVVKVYIQEKKQCVWSQEGGFAKVSGWGVYSYDFLLLPSTSQYS